MGESVDVGHGHGLHYEAQNAPYCVNMPESRGEKAIHLFISAFLVEQSKIEYSKSSRMMHRYHGLTPQPTAELGARTLPSLLVGYA
ncbi:hypothetical protein AVEN_206214-1 [Araneus ventricosus]|uniref:Uncharacterized protein n=1 Tax=Araneus ventricosus TaxID=182803 RepID=A0A4Y2GCJ0_ARAVE|nr:hypothetical protein AVEN_206214-1 [Araneus ventricosus]